MINNNERKLKDNESLFDENDPRWEEYTERFKRSMIEKSIVRKEYEIAVAKVLEYGGIKYVPKDKQYLVDEYFDKKKKFEDAIDAGDRLSKEYAAFRDYMMGGKPDTDILS